MKINIIFTLWFYQVENIKLPGPKVGCYVSQGVIFKTFYFLFIYLFIFFEKKGNKNLTTPYSIPFLSVLHQNKVLHNFHKRGQRPTVGHRKGLD